MAHRLDDPDRLASLSSLGPLTRGPDEHFDRLARLVSSVLGAGVALICLVDEHRQVLLGAHGLVGPWAERREVPIGFSLCHRVVTSGEPLCVEDAGQASHALGVFAYLGVPLVTGDGHCVGALCAIGGAPRSWQVHEVERMRAFAEVVIRELELRRSARALARERASVDLLLAIAKAANQTDVPAEALRSAIEHVCRYAGWPLGHLLLAGNGVLTPTGVWYCEDPARYRVFQAATEAMTFSSATLVGRLLGSGAPIWATAIGSHPQFRRGSAALYAGLETGFVAPILVGDEVVAAIELYTPDHQPPMTDLMTVVAEAAAMLGRVVERDRARRQRDSHAAELERRSRVDDLTGLLNRRGFFTLAEQELAAARRKRRPALVFFLDLDGLKETNDTHGHEAGDALLTGAAAMLRATFRDADVLARLGGDEFVVLAPDVRVEDVESILARLHGEAHRINQRRAHPLAWSVGIAAFDPERPEPLEELLKRADALMYEHKRRRRKRRSSLDEQRAAG